MKRIFSILLISTLAFMVPARGQVDLPALPTLSDSAFASLITCGVGNEYYLSWGHTAIRICDPTMHLDVAYNYGTFDFDTPHFYWKFACGNLDYCLSRTNYERFLTEYVYERRAVWEQRLRLTPQEVKNLFIMLETNYLPEYRYYKYDFFRDNCATRVRDMIAGCLVHRTLSPEVPAEAMAMMTTGGSPKSGLTWRDHLYLPTERTKLWWRLGVDITLGMRCDHPCTNYEAMFSPIIMMHTFDTLTVVETGTPIAYPATKVLNDYQEPLAESVPPTIVFWALFLLVAAFTVVQARRLESVRLARISTAIDRTLYITTAVISLLIIFLWFFTSHYCTKYNLNILWASPLFIYFAVCPTQRNKGVWKWLAALQVLMLLATVVFCFYPHPQRINIALCPVALTLAMRLIYEMKRKQ